MMILNLLPQYDNLAGSHSISGNKQERKQGITHDKVER